MGLSKKLGGITQNITLPVSRQVPYKWSNQTYTVGEIVNKFKLPCVVQCVTDSCTVVWSDFQFDLQQPLMLYSRRNVQKVHAVCLNIKKDTLEELSPSLVIPVDYEGWFGAAPKDVNIAKRHLRIEGIAKSTARRFLVTTKCPAFTTCRNPTGNLDYVPHDIMPGELLKKVCIMDFDATEPDQPQLVLDHGPCLECLDEKDEPVVIPFSHRVMTYEVAETYPDDEERVFQIASLIQAGNSGLPRVLTLVHGDPPSLAYAFTSTIRCCSVFTEETLQAATLDNQSSRCLELATDSCAKFRLALNEAVIKKTCEYANALQTLETVGPKFITGIKVSFSLKPETSDLDDLDLSLYESVSDMQEVEANSEFEIAWNTVKKAKLHIQTSRESENEIDDDKGSEQSSSGGVEEIQTDTIVPSKVSDGSDSSLPQHRDFTEQEIKDLVLRKSTGNESEKHIESKSQEIDALKENRVTDNPLFYFFQRNPNQNPWKSLEIEERESPDDDLVKTDDNKLESERTESPPLVNEQNKDLPKVEQSETNPLLYLFEPPCKTQQIKDRLAQSEACDEQELEVSSGDEYSDPEVARFNDIVCTPAKEYSESEEDSDCADDNSEVSHNDHEDNDDNEYDDDDDDNDDALYVLPGLDIKVIEEKTLPIMTISSSTRDRNESKDSDSELSDIETHKTQALRFPPGMDRQVMREKVFMPLKVSSDAGSRTQLAPSSTSEGTFSQPSRVATTNSLIDDKTKVHPTLSDETQAVKDLLFLVEKESNEKSNNASAEVDPSDTQSGQSPTTSNSLDPLFRLNNLLEEVSILVSKSSDRILDNKKSINYENVDNGISLRDPQVEEYTYSCNPLAESEDSTVATLKEPVVATDNEFIERGEKEPSDKIIPCKTLSPVLFSADICSDGSVTHTGSISNTIKPQSHSAIKPLRTAQKHETDIAGTVTNSKKFNSDDVCPPGSFSSENCSSASAFSVARRLPNSKVISPPSAKKSKSSNAVNLYAADLHSKQSKTEEISHGIRRSRVEIDLAHIDADNTQNVSPKNFLRTLRTNSTISSIFRVDDQDNRYTSSRVKFHVHDHPHNRYSMESDDTENNHLQVYPYMSDTGDSDASQQESRRNDSFNQGKVLASVQNFQRLGSASSSISSNHSSSIGSSYRQGSPKLVIISDGALNLSDTTETAFSDQNTEQFVFISDSQGYSNSTNLGARDNRRFQDSNDEDANMDEHFAMSKSGRVKHNKLTRTRGKMLLDHMSEDFV